MALVETQDLRGSQDFVRWAACAAIVLAVHAGLALALLHHRDEEVDLDFGVPVVTIELSPLVAAPATPATDLAPGPEQREVETEQRPPEQVKPEPEIKPESETPPVPQAAVTLPPPEPPRPEGKPEEPQQEPKDSAPVPTAPPSITAPAPRPATPAIGRVPQPSARAIASWQRQLVVHLERHKRYPPQARGRQGVATLVFTMDRQGRVLSSRIAASSGSLILDEEALAMIRRAQPLPAPPPDIADDRLSFTVPIRYGAGARR